jgi:uncharacterized membrane protein
MGFPLEPWRPLAYLILNLLHVIGAKVIMGNGTGIAYFMLMAHLSRDAAFIGKTAAIVVLADMVFTAIAVTAQPPTGFLIASSVGSMRPEPPQQDHDTKIGQPSMPT